MENRLSSIMVHMHSFSPGVNRLPICKMHISQTREAAGSLDPKYQDAVQKRRAILVCEDVSGCTESGMSSIVSRHRSSRRRRCAIARLAIDCSEEYINHPLSYFTCVCTSPTLLKAHLCLTHIC